MKRIILTVVLAISSIFCFASVNTKETKSNITVSIEKQQKLLYLHSWSFTVTDACGETWIVTGTSQADLPLIVFVDAVMNWIESNTGSNGCISDGGPQSYYY